MHKWLKLNGPNKSRQTIVLKGKHFSIGHLLSWKWSMSDRNMFTAQSPEQESSFTWCSLGKTFHSIRIWVKVVTGSFLSCQNQGLNYVQPYWMLICANVGDLCPSNSALEGSKSVCESSTSTILLQRSFFPWYSFCNARLPKTGKHMCIWNQCRRSAVELWSEAPGLRKL